VNRTEKATDKYVIFSQVNVRNATTADKKRAAKKNNRKNSRRVAKQCLCFIGAWCLAWGFVSLDWLVKVVGVRNDFWSDFIDILVVTTVPLQGFLNAFIYMRPRYEYHKQRNRDWNSRQIYAKIISDSLDHYRWFEYCTKPCGCYGNANKDDRPLTTHTEQQSNQSNGQEVLRSIAERPDADVVDQNAPNIEDEIEKNDIDVYLDDEDDDIVYIDDDSIDDVNDNEVTERERAREQLRRAISYRRRSSLERVSEWFRRSSGIRRGSIDEPDENEIEQSCRNIDIILSCGKGVRLPQKQRQLNLQECYQQGDREYEVESEQKISEDS